MTLGKAKKGIANIRPKNTLNYVLFFAYLQQRRTLPKQG